MNFVMIAESDFLFFLMSPDLHYDLHAHSCVSDGVLTPTLLLERAASRQVDVLALTDHDDTRGLAEAAVAAARLGVRLVNGVEISVSWQKTTLHVVGLGIDPTHVSLAEGLAAIRAGRRERAERIAVQLARFGVPEALAGALRHAANPDLIGRMHFARDLVERGICKDIQSVFKRYLAKGRPGYVSHQWAEMADAIGWIRESGGQAVLAHPGRYELGSGRLTQLLNEFRDAGGEAIEVVTGSHTPDQFIRFARLAREHGLLSSRGSDFHSPEEHWRDLGRLAKLPDICTPVWQHWSPA